VTYWVTFEMTVLAFRSSIPSCCESRESALWLWLLLLTTCKMQAKRPHTVLSVVSS